MDSRILWLNRFASIHPGQFKQTQGLVTAKSAWYTVGIFKFNWTINITVFRAYIYFTLQYGHKKKVNGTIGNSYVIATQSLKCEGLHHQIAKIYGLQNVSLMKTQFLLCETTDITLRPRTSSSFDFTIL